MEGLRYLLRDRGTIGVSGLYPGDVVRSTLNQFLLVTLENLSIYLAAESPLSAPLVTVIYAAIAFPMLVVFAGVVIKSLTELFKNIVVQNLVIEACIIAEYLMLEGARAAATQKSSLAGHVFELIA